MRKIQIRPEAITSVCKAAGGISRDELARRMGVSTGTTYRVDAGRVEPSPRFIATLMFISGRKFEDLFDVVEDAA